MIRSGTRIEFHVSGRTGGLAPVNAGEVQQNASDYLNGFFDGVVVNVVRPGLMAVLDPSQWYYWNYTATFTGTVKSDYADIYDLDKVVAHAFYAAAGELPEVTAPAYGEGEPGGVSENPDQTPHLPELPNLTFVVVAALVVAGVVIFAVVKTA
jgi:hypothetical protein